MSQSAHASTPTPVVAEPTALGLFGLAIACASLLPVVFGVKSAFTPEALTTISWFCLLFGAGCQFLAGLLSFLNKNMLGGTLLTTFSFNWVMNWWTFSQLAQGKSTSSTIVLAVDACFLLVFIVMTAAFGFHSKLLFLFLLDIDVLYGLRIAKELTHSPTLAMPMAISVVVMMAIALYIAFSLVLANAAGRIILPMPGPLFRAGPAVPKTASADRTLELRPLASF